MPLPATSTEAPFFANQAGKVYYHPAAYVRLVWQPGRLPLDAIQEVYEHVLLLLLRSDVRRILSEHGLREPLTQVAQEWITNSFIPRTMQQASCYHCAILEGTNPIHRLSTQSIVSAAPSGFFFRRFDTLEAADTWLRELAV